MFGLNIYTWNTEYRGGKYSKSIKRAILGGSSGHASAELTIPATSENKELIDAVNKNNKLIISEETTLITKTDDDGLNKLYEIPCYKIYFSFWGDVKTKKSTEGHRMVRYDKDRIEEGEGVPIEISSLTKKFALDEIKWHGFFSTTEGAMLPREMHHLSGLNDKDISLSREQLDKLHLLESEKELTLFHLKQILTTLKKLKQEAKRDSYLSSPQVIEVFKSEEVSNLNELKNKLANMSIAINEIREILSKKGVRFGTNPDNTVHFPLNIDGLKNTLDYRAILLKMGNLANLPNSYKAFSMNCSTAIIDVIQSGITDALITRTKKAGYSFPKPNLLFQTPQSVYEYSLKLSSICLNTELGMVNNPSSKRSNFSFRSVLHYYICKLLNYIFSQNKKNVLQDLKSKYEKAIENTKEGLSKLEKEHDSQCVSTQVYTELKQNGINLIKKYSKQLTLINKKLLPIDEDTKSGKMQN